MNKKNTLDLYSPDGIIHSFKIKWLIIKSENNENNELILQDGNYHCKIIIEKFFYYSLKLYLIRLINY